MDWVEIFFNVGCFLWISCWVGNSLGFFFGFFWWECVFLMVVCCVYRCLFWVWNWVVCRCWILVCVYWLVEVVDLLVVWFFFFLFEWKRFDCGRWLVFIYSLVEVDCLVVLVIWWWLCDRFWNKNWCSWWFGWDDVCGIFWWGVEVDFFVVWWCCWIFFCLVDWLVWNVVFGVLGGLGRIVCLVMVFGKFFFGLRMEVGWVCLYVWDWKFGS